MGGLGDVVTGLARACLERGHDVEVLLPFYECLPQDQIDGLQHDMDFDCPKARRKFLPCSAQHNRCNTRIAFEQRTCAAVAVAAGRSAAAVAKPQSSDSGLWRRWSALRAQGQNTVRLYVTLLHRA